MKCVSKSLWSPPTSESIRIAIFGENFFWRIGEYAGAGECIVHKEVKKVKSQEIPPLSSHFPALIYR
jgi:hypothetical protein